MGYCVNMVVHRRVGINSCMCRVGDFQVVAMYSPNEDPLQGFAFCGRMMNNLVIVLIFLVIYLSLCGWLGGLGKTIMAFLTIESRILSISSSM